MAVKKEQTVTVDSQHLPARWHGWLETQLKMFGGVLGNSPGNTVQDIYKRCLSSVYKQRLFSKKLKSSLNYHIPSNLSCIIWENNVHSSTPEDTVTRNKKRLMLFTLLHVHRDVLDSLDIGNLIKSFISTNPKCCTAQHTATSSPLLRGEQLLQTVYHWQSDQHHWKFTATFALVPCYVSLLISKDFCILMIVWVFF